MPLGKQGHRSTMARHRGVPSPMNYGEGAESGCAQPAQGAVTARPLVTDIPALPDVASSPAVPSSNRGYPPRPASAHAPCAVL